MEHQQLVSVGVDFSMNSFTKTSLLPLTNKQNEKKNRAHSNLAQQGRSKIANL